MANILLIEPDRILAKTYATFLHAHGHHVRICATAQAAIHAADDLTPDMVVLELQLVAHSGIEFLYEFRSYYDWRQVPVVVLSAVPPAEFNSSTGVLRDQLGIHSYHYKPQTTVLQLLDVVQNVVGSVV